MKVSRSLVVGSLAIALLGLGAANPISDSVHAMAPLQASVVGTLQPGFATTTPATFQVITRSGATTVTVTNGTALVRRYNALSSLAEFQPGDLLGVTGAMNPDHTMTATAIKDFTIQAGFTDNVGAITAFSTNSAGAITQLKLRVQADPHDAGLSPLRPGQVVSIDVSPAMTLTLSDGRVGTVADLLADTNNNPIGLTLFTIGVYNRNTATFERLYRMRVLSPTKGSLTVVDGVLQQAPASAAAPTTLMLATRYQGSVSVSVDTTTRFVRHFNGQSSLGELSAGDSIAVVGIYNGGSSFSAKAVKDLSIQRGYTFYGQLTSINSSSVTVLVLANNRLHPRDPIHIGDKVAIPLSANTVVTDGAGHTSAVSALQPGMRVILVSVYSYKARNFTAVDRIRVVA